MALAAAGAHYIDLADGRRFVCGFAAADPAFRAAGKTGINGASTVPALSSAVVDHLCAGWQHIASIDTCNAPAKSAPRGKATLEAVLGYCGAPIAMWLQSRWQTQLGWAQPEPIGFARLRPRTELVILPIGLAQSISTQHDRKWLPKLSVRRVWRQIAARLGRTRLRCRRKHTATVRRQCLWAVVGQDGA